MGVLIGSNDAGASVSPSAKRRLASEVGMGDFLMACERGEDALVKQMLVKNRQDIEARNSHGHTGLWLATAFGHTNIVKFLIDRGANVDAADKNRRSVLMIAVFTRHREAVRMLVDRGANREARSTMNETALDWAQGSKSIRLLLLDDDDA